MTRHPAYAGELLLVLGCFLAKPGLLPAGVLGAALRSVMVRILIEEQVLMREAAYQVYAARVRWRLLPGLW